MDQAETERQQQRCERCGVELNPDKVLLVGYRMDRTQNPLRPRLNINWTEILDVGADGKINTRFSDILDKHGGVGFAMFTIDTSHLEHLAGLLVHGFTKIIASPPVDPKPKKVPKRKRDVLKV